MAAAVTKHPRDRRPSRRLLRHLREAVPLTIASDYASSVVLRFFDVRSPVAQYISIPQSYVIFQRINLGLFAVLGDLTATANWRAISDEIWPSRRDRLSLPWERPRPHGGPDGGRSRRDWPLASA